jgi:hypothetical protein
MTDPSNLQPLKIAPLELNRETLQDLVEETAADLVEDEAAAVRGGLIDGRFLVGKDSQSCKAC